MAQLLFELFSEEIPARMQAQAAEDLRRLFAGRLEGAGLAAERLESFAGPRRLVLVADGLPTAQADRVEEVKGPRLGAPPAALEGFLRSQKAAREDLVERDGAYFLSRDLKGRATRDVIAEIAPSVIAEFPWPKSMTWGAGALRWVRPLQSILCVFDGEIVPVEVEGLVASDVTRGHRVMGQSGPIRVRAFDAYEHTLLENRVILRASERKRRILEGARAACASRGLELIEDPGLLDEVAGLVEWPAPIVGDMDPRFLDLPPEVIRTSMRTHLRFFAVRAPGAPGLAPHFLVVANVEARDGGVQIAAGNAKVLSARLNDARFFWEEDRKVPLADRLARLEGVTFHARLGSMRARAERIARLARRIAPYLGVDPDAAETAGRLSKADLATYMVGEFPELQGVMGGYYAALEGLDAEVAGAIRDHYRPQGPSDALPETALGAAVALADKLDTLASFFSIGERPTGSRDPFALRRAALGVIRILSDRRVRAPISALAPEGSADDIVAFIAERLKVSLRESGRRHDLVDAALATPDDDVVRMIARVAALEAFLAGEDGANLLAGYRRAANILKSEAKKGPLPDGAPAERADSPAAEVDLIRAAATTRGAVEQALAADDFDAAMLALAALRGPVDRFFEGVLVNAPEADVRDNRLRLLSEVRANTDFVADFSRISG